MESLNLHNLARGKHCEDIISNKFPFLESTVNNADTYELGFMKGVSLAAKILSVPIPAPEKRKSVNCVTIAENFFN